MARAAYIAIEYLESIINPLVAPDSISFHPGKWAPEETDDTFAVYKYVPNRDYSQPYIHMDSLNVRIYHTNYMKLKEISDLILSKLNSENIHDNPDLVSLGKAEGVWFQETVARVADSSQNSFVESTEYYYDVIDILLQYSKIPFEKTFSSILAYV